MRGNQIEINPHHPCGEICIFIDGTWAGYIDEEFSECMKKDIDPRDEQKILRELYGIFEESWSGPTMGPFLFRRSFLKCEDPTFIIKIASHGTLIWSLFARELLFNNDLIFTDTQGP